MIDRSLYKVTYSLFQSSPHGGAVVDVEMGMFVSVCFSSGQ